MKELAREDLQKEKFKKNIFNDDPRYALLHHAGYGELVKLVKSASNNDIANAIEKWIIDNENELADLIGEERYINCEHAAEMVSQILSDAKISHALQVGIIDGQSHAWVKANGNIIDPTKDQFPNISTKDYNHSVTWEKYVDA